jgi:hypothetical protein
MRPFRVCFTNESAGLFASMLKLELDQKAYKSVDCSTKETLLGRPRPFLTDFIGISFILIKDYRTYF